jgi:DNA-binding NtrC family response regulator
MPLPSSSCAHERMTLACVCVGGGGGFAAGMTAVLAEQAWDIVLAAHRMLAFDAFTTLAVLGASGVDVPLIVISGESGEETAVAAVHAGAADFVSRDHVDCLGVMVARCLRHQRVIGSSVTCRASVASNFADPGHDWPAEPPEVAR